MADAAIAVKGLRKRFGTVQALCGIDLTAPPGSVLGLLGPNGAGKTTAVRILTTLLPPDDGTARVAGLDVVKDADALRSRIGASATFSIATTDFTAKDGDAYPFTAQGLTFTPVGALYNQAFEDYIVAPAAEGGLGGTVTAARYPEVPSGVRRITILGD